MDKKKKTARMNWYVRAELDLDGNDRSVEVVSRQLTDDATEIVSVVEKVLDQKPDISVDARFLELLSDPKHNCKY